MDVVDQAAQSKNDASASHLDPERDHFALVYEFLPNDSKGSKQLQRDAVQRQLSFLYHIGFQPCQGVHADNWQAPGVLLDLGDYEAPVLREFRGNIAYHACPDAEWIVDKEGAEKRAREKWEEEEGGLEEAMRKVEEKWDGGEKQDWGEEDGRGQKEGGDVPEEERERALRETAKAVEASYQDGEGLSGYCECKSCQRISNPVSICLARLMYGVVTAEERREKGLLDDPLSHIDTPEIKPEAVRDAWGTYQKQREEYLSKMGN
jgi:hypothetical protein